ncbi:hypothetical protein [Actimicrobium sp. CCI2.3]|uniref:hypothetical protein n=1 Tax=Actimicrobium sp. CCI2.3 TaxID=3048616 RepID=UPI002AB43948|nr:hypothetical protein [Actimicrobium sp. CCI2.3]MDY7574795.1 hypothetical protein [Actimicrobium sp. CCI2.3]MEB0020244.1 hypothetical protein [Actimicrobium sp. CCI2.3]
MSNALVLKAASLIRAGDIAGAEFALVSLAEAEGDRALVAVLEEMPPKDLLAVIREFDSSHESVVNLVVTPEQFARALVMERLYGDHTHTHLRGMINAVLFREGSDTDEFLDAIGDIDGGCEALIDYLQDHDEMIVHFANYGTFNHLHTRKAVEEDEEAEGLAQDVHAEEDDVIDKSEASDHDWKEVTWLLRNYHPDMFEQILPQIKKRLKKRLQAEAELERMELDPTAVPARREAPAVSNKPVAGPDEESAL